MLACRFSSPGSVQYNRRLDPASRIVDIVSSEGHETLPPLPLVPYALAMSTAMIYRGYRDAQKDKETTTACLHRCCDSLDGLSRRWSKVQSVARLARRLLKMLSKSAAVGQQHSGNQREAGTRPTAASAQETLSPGCTFASLDQTPVAAVLTPISLSDTQVMAQDVDATQWQIANAMGPLDRTFHTMFDYGMPSVVREHTMWELLQPMDESMLGGIGSGERVLFGSG